MASITIKAYFLTLQRVSEGKIRNIHDLSGNENRMARELMRAGLISNDDSLNSFERRVHGAAPLTITPEGIGALVSWSTQIKSDSFLHKCGDNLMRLLWLVVGLMLSSIIKYLG